MRIECCVYRYAPEQTRIWVDGKLFSPQYTEFSHDIGYLMAIGKEKEAFDKIKREVRQQYKQRRRVTFGFFGKGNNRYFYTRELGAFDDDLQDKLRVYKEWKRYCITRNCDLSTHVITSGEFTPDGMKNTKVKESTDIVDITRPVKLKFPYRRPYDEL